MRMLPVGLAAAAAVAAMAGDGVQPGLGPAIDVHRSLSEKEWPQLQNTPQRTGYSPCNVRPPVRVRWQTRLADVDPVGITYAAAQAIVADDRVYVGCKSGRMHAFDAGTGTQIWAFAAGGPILHTAGYAGGKLFFGAMDGRIYAVNAPSGEPAWTFGNERRFGFSTAALLAEDKVFLADRGGRLFAVRQDDGREAWHYDAEAPVLQSAAWEKGRVYFASEDMRVHAVDAASGQRLWRSGPLAGMSFMDYWPVVVGGQVIVRSMASHGPHPLDYRKPGDRTMFVFDALTGEETAPFEHYQYGMHGPHPPPAVTRDGLLVVPWPVVPEEVFIHKYKSAKDDRGWVLQDLTTQAALLRFLHTGPALPGVEDFLVPGVAPVDETIIPSVFGSDVAVIHHHGVWFAGGGQQQYGIYGLANQRWNLMPSITGWSRTPNSQGGGANAMSAAGGRLYHVASTCVLVCYEPAPEDAAAAAERTEGGR
jgi:hypothetical protein